MPEFFAVVTWEDEPDIAGLSEAACAGAPYFQRVSRNVVVCTPEPISAEEAQALEFRARESAGREGVRYIELLGGRHGVPC
jgi:hypothetical protein